MLIPSIISVGEILHGLGFTNGTEITIVRSTTFSGGQRRRVLLAKLLLSSPDVMLLDEPSNHLDIGATGWLEEYLARRPEGMIVVSHDRYFLGQSGARRFSNCTPAPSRRIPGTFASISGSGGSVRAGIEGMGIAAANTSRSKRNTFAGSISGQLAKQAQARAKALDRIERLEKPTWWAARG